MDTNHLDSYLVAWSHHFDSSEATAATMVAAASTDMVYGDINLPDDFKGADGLRAMCNLASGILPRAAMTIDRLIVEGDAWAMRWVLDGKAAGDGAPYSIKGSSWGKLGPDGKVSRQIDYWNPAHFEQQTGTALF